MQSSKQNYLYEERNQNFPQSLSSPKQPKQQSIGKILSKYQKPTVQSYDINPHQKKPVHLGMAINYSQIYNDIKMSAASPFQPENAEKPKQYHHPQIQRKNPDIFKSPYNFQSSTEIGNHIFGKKMNMGVIINTPRGKPRPTQFISSKDQQQQRPTRNEGQRQNYKYRVRQIYDQNQKRVNFQDISELEAASIKSMEKQQKKDISIQENLGNSRSIGVGHHQVLQSYDFKVQDEELVEEVKEEKPKELAEIEEVKETLTQREIQEENKKEANEEIIVHYEKNQSKVNSQGMPNSQHESRVASTIKPTPDQSHFVEEIDQNINLDHPDDQNQLIENEQQKQEQIIDQPFSLEEYSQIYPILKSMQTALKASLINVQELFRGIKKYLQIIAMGNLDNIDQFNLPLHKKKIVKNAIFYERVSVIIIAFAYATKTIKQSHKYLINVLSYALNNSLILVKILEQSQIPQFHQAQSKHRTLIKSDKLSMKRNLDSLRNNNDVLIDSITKLSKYEDVFYQNLKQTIKLINKSSLQQTFYNVLEYFSFYLSVSELGHMIPFLAVAPDPYLTVTVGKKYTLVIDVVELFCHGTKKSKSFVFRPYSQHFLHEMSQYYEIVSFCSAFPNQIDKIIDMVDPKKYIQHRLYKHHAVQKNKINVKYVERIGRPLDQLILLDNEGIGGQGSLDNCIHIPPWRGNKNDTILAQLCPLLAMIPIKRINAQSAVKKVRDQAFKNQKEGVKYINFGVILD